MLCNSRFWHKIGKHLFNRFRVPHIRFQFAPKHLHTGKFGAHPKTTRHVIYRHVPIRNWFMARTMDWIVKLNRSMPLMHFSIHAARVIRGHAEYVIWKQHTGRSANRSRFYFRKKYGFDSCLRNVAFRWSNGTQSVHKIMLEYCFCTITFGGLTLKNKNDSFRLDTTHLILRIYP